MTMNDGMLLLSWLAGALLGTIFFAGLWWTVRKGLASPRPALWFITSLLLRTGIVLSGFYFVANGDWQRLLLCLLGFFIARPLVTRWTRPSGNELPGQASEVIHAPHS